MPDQEFRADLHIHSRFSRATSKSLNLPLLAAWGAIKGLNVLGTGDFTHPVWREELRESLELDERSGLYRLKDAKTLKSVLPDWAGMRLPEEGGRTLFMLQAEISSIYKRHGKVRKVHNLVYMPTLEAAEAFSVRLGAVGNLNSDGRPILGMDSEDLLDLVLNTHADAFLIPAHIWTPWFSVFGSKSGFDRLEDCYGSLTEHIFALETGLSSDPEMNRRLSALDRYALVSNSDAHSGENLAREANLFSGELSYQGMLAALRGARTGHEGPTRFLGTFEFFPDEGKYHLDGHRACNVRLTPEETREHGGICPVCGKPVTVGVLYRVGELADRAEPLYRADEKFTSFIPLPEMIGEVLDVGSKSRKVGDFYRSLLGKLGSELDILNLAPLEDIARISTPLAEGISRMRRGEVFRQGGFDGEFGVISVFSPEERRDLKSGRQPVGGGKTRSLSLINGVDADKKPAKSRSRKAKGEAAKSAGLEEAGKPGDRKEFSDQDKDASGPEHLPDNMPEQAAAQRRNAGPKPSQNLNAAQEAAVSAGPGPVICLAGPGTGKTHTLVARVMRLMASGIPARKILAVTFTRRAAAELEERISAAGRIQLPRADTLHALAMEFWTRVQGESPLLMTEDAARRVFDEANAGEGAAKRKAAWDAVGLCREKREPLPEAVEPMFERYTQHKAAWNLVDYTDLLEFWLTQLKSDLFPSPWEEVLVDEVQDLSALQLELLLAICPPDGRGFFGIGDPDQSIYGFRGAYGQVVEYLGQHWPGLAIYRLAENYRSGRKILDISHVLVKADDNPEPLEAKSDLQAEVHFFEANSSESEATWVVGHIRRLLGATSHTLLDGGSADAGGTSFAAGSYSPGDFAILMRTRALMLPMRRALERAGIPFSQPSRDPFWMEQRVAKILEVAGRMLGISMAAPDFVSSTQAALMECPDRVLVRGPLSMAAYWGNSEPFDNKFWQSREFKQLAEAYEEHGGWAGLLSWIGLQTELEGVSAKSEKVQLMTIHAAKGLEFRMVFLPALEDGLMPFAGHGFLTGQLGQDQMDLAEEKRLLYVGMTRAKEGLFLSGASRRHLYNREMRLKPSRFLNLLPLDQIKRSAMVAKTNTKVEQLKLF